MWVLWISLWPGRLSYCLAGTRNQWLRAYTSSANEGSAISEIVSAFSQPGFDVTEQPNKKEAKQLEKGEARKKLGPWRPSKRLSRYEMDHLRSLRGLQPAEWTLGKLSRKFGVSMSAVKRILRSKFDPSAEVEERQEERVRQQRLERREKSLMRSCRLISEAQQQHSDQKIREL